MAGSKRQENYAYAHYTSGSNSVKKGPGVLKAIIIGTSAAGTITIEDAQTDTTPVIAVLTAVASVGPVVVEFNTKFQTGLFVKLSATMDVTVVYE